jgi:hypothetical protein
MRPTFIIIFLAFFSGSCQNKTRQTNELKKGISFSGVFVKEERTNQREAKLYLKNEKGETIEFISMPFFGEIEQMALRHDGKPNINIVYNEFYNPVRKRTENIIKILTTVYGEKE